MLYTFRCPQCHKIELVNSKDELKELRNKHFTGYGKTKKHVPVLQTMHVQMRTSKSGRAYPVLVAD